MSIHDGDMYTGVDQPGQGMFGNEGVTDEKTAELLEDQKRQLDEIIPQIESVLTKIDIEIKAIENPLNYLEATRISEDDIRSELRANALYLQKLQQLRSTLVVAFNATRKAEDHIA